MWYFVIALFTSVFFTLFVRRFALDRHIVDLPDLNRKRHPRPVPLLGGVAIFLSFWLVLGFVLMFQPVNGILILKQKLIATFWTSLIIVILGVVDEVRPLGAKLRLGITALAVAVGIVLGLGLDKITNPLGGFFGISSILSAAITFLWLMGMMYTTKITDGLDGLTTGVVTIGAIIIYLLTTSTTFFQPNVALVSAIFAGVCAGFLLFNFYPAKIFLGESGSLLLGLILGVLAIISGGKLATALLVMAIPTLDLARVMYVRRRHGQPLFKGDRTHLHFQLLTLGLSERTVVLVYYGIATVFGLLTLVLHSIEKIIAFIILAAVMVFIGFKLEERG